MALLTVQCSAVRSKPVIEKRSSVIKYILPFLNADLYEIFNNVFHNSPRRLCPTLRGDRCVTGKSHKARISTTVRLTPVHYAHTHCALLGLGDGAPGLGDLGLLVELGPIRHHDRTKEAVAEGEELPIVVLEVGVVQRVVL